MQVGTLHWQTSEMRKLRQQYPDAYSGGAVFHGTGLSPDVVLLSGIPPTGGRNYDLSAHQRQFSVVGQSDQVRSALRGSCQAADTPAGFAGPGGFVYKLVPVGGGIDVNSALGPKKLDLAAGSLQGSIMPGETEIAIASHQPSCQIEGYYQVGQYSEVHGKFRLGPFIPNPNFEPGAWESKTFLTEGRAA